MRLVALSAAVFASAIALAASGSTVPAGAVPNSNIKAKSTTSKKVTVQPGDYLAQIAEEEGTDWQRMFYANLKIEDPDVILPGSELRVPAAGEQLVPRPIPSNAPVVPVAEPVPAQPVYTGYEASTPQPAYNPAPAPVAGGGVWDQLAQCESGGNWNTNTGNGYSGGLQFSQSSWTGVGGTGLAGQASKAEQIVRAQQLQAQQGWGAWPACSAKLGL